jgi:hypothetical protein
LEDHVTEIAEPTLPQDRLDEIAESHPGDWYSGEWRTEYVVSTPDEPSYYVVKHHESGTVLAELPDWAGPIALFITDAHDAVPTLVARVAELEATLERYVGKEPTVADEMAYLHRCLNAVFEVCRNAEKQAIRWENPLPVPEWVSDVRSAAAGEHKNQPW